MEETEEGIDSEFFNDLFAWNIERNRYFPLALRKPRSVKKSQPVERGGRRGRGQANEEELLRNLAALETGKSIENADLMELDMPRDEELAPGAPEKKMVMEFPHPRFNAQLAVQNDVLYIYGGTFEKGDREYTLDELYAIDLGKLDGVKEIFRREPENWLGSDDEDSESDEGSDGDDEEEDDGEDEDSDAIMVDTPTYEDSPRKSRRNKNAADDGSESISTVSLIADEESEAAISAVNDSLPHPRPFESRRDFFQRTSNEWQEILIQSLRWKDIQPETLSVKEIKTKAFEMSEEKWWDCREEITALEDEQEEAGIGEVVTLADRGEAGVVGRRR